MEVLLTEIRDFIGVIVLLLLFLTTIVTLSLTTIVNLLRNKE